MSEPSTRDPPEPDRRMEFISESARTRVTRIWMGGVPYIQKTPLGPDAEKRRRHEVAVLERLSGVPGVASLAKVQPDPKSILLNDGMGVRLSERPMPLDNDALMSLALDLANILAAMHRRGVAHRNLRPEAVLLTGSQETPCVIGLGFATTFAETRPEFTLSSEIDGAPAYLAPEQTGRTGRPVDHRVDLYAMGAMLYELAVGTPPFGMGDPLQLIHDHLARLPTPPDAVTGMLPPGLSDVIMRLLEKEPDNRYQTAEGLAYDLALIHDPPRGGLDAYWRAGGHDFPNRLVPPSRIVGRDAEIAALDTALSETLAGRGRGVIISGPAGVGKTSLINELLSIVTARDGWFVAGKFDPYRRDLEFDAAWQAFHSLGRLLLAAPDEEVADVRERLLRSVGPYAGLLAALHPEFEVLLQVAPDPTVGDPLTAEARLPAVAADLLRIVASPKRPVVFVLDDLQWATRMPLGFVDTVLNDDSMKGLLLVGAYREEAVDATHPLAAMMTRWRRSGADPEHLRLRNLPPPTIAAMLTDMLRLDPVRAAELADAISPHTRGNPYDTVELLNSLRNDGVLVAGDEGWHWDWASLNACLRRADVTSPLAQRVRAMPTPARELLDVMACLGGKVQTSLLEAAVGQPADVVDEQITPALDDGLLVWEPGAHDSVRFRHDRVQETLLDHMTPTRQRAVRLRLARRLAEDPDLFAVAAEQYLPVISEVREADERRRVAELLSRAAGQAAVGSNFHLVERCLATTIQVLDPDDRAAIIDAQTGRLTALYNLGRLDDADAVYQEIDRISVSPLERADATLVQVSSLTNRNQPHEAVRLGLELLREFGSDVPARENLIGEIERGLDFLYRWVDEDADDADRAEIDDPSILATAALINRVMPPAYTVDQPMMAWLALEAVRMWAKHGPARTLVGPIGHVAFVTIAQRNDYRTGKRALERILAVGDQREYEPDISEAWFLHGFGTGPWFDPIEENVNRLAAARERLIHGGDLQNACYTYIPLMQQLIDCAPTLDDFMGELESARAFAGRTANDLVSEMVRAFQAAGQTLQGSDGSVTGQPASVTSEAGTPPALAVAYFARTLSAAVMGETDLLIRNSRAMMDSLPAQEGSYITATARMLRALAIITQIKLHKEQGERDTLLVELDEIIEWLAARSAEAPHNFLHLLRLAEAERAQAVGDFRGAAYAYDVAQQVVMTRPRPWHRALIHESAARFYLSQNMEHAGYALMAAARREYIAWGAFTKVSQLDWAYPALQTRIGAVAAPGHTPTDDMSIQWETTTSGAIDLYGILAASQALSSATSIERVRARIVDVLGAMTGATLVNLLVWNRDDQRWLLSVPGEGEDALLPLDDAGHRQLVPMSVVRYAERTREPLVLSDATKDDRFARDPYLASLDTCSMLVVPIVSRGASQALLLLENRLIRGAFAADRLDGVMLIAGQLAVSLENVRAYASLERTVAVRTRELAEANERLELLSITDALSGLANRRRFEQVLNTEWRHAGRTRSPISLAMVDVDHFKLYNDHYGHPAGDECLQRIAAQLKRQVRDTDLVARYGGEEFAIIMPDTPLASAVDVAERLRVGVVESAEPHGLTAERVVTVSVGVASVVPSRDTQPTQLIEAADVELYKAKRGGRNRVRAAVDGA